MVYKSLKPPARKWRISANGPDFAPCLGMWRRIGRLFIIKTRFEAMAVIYALGLGAIERGMHYLDTYPGFGGWLLASACTGAVFMAGARLMEFTRKDSGQRRRKSDLESARQELA